ncbi:MAG: GNAT family N-acetyltransferase [Candidatus Micrarchaeota archaeon]
MKLTIRKAKLRDVELLIPLALELMMYVRNLNRKKTTEHDILKLIPDVKKLWKKWAIKNIKSQNSYVVVAVVDDEIVGYSMNFIKKNVPVYAVKKIGYVSDLYVKSGYRNKGIASKFKNLAFKWFKKKGLKYSSIAVYHKNIKAHAIYKKWGFFDYKIEMIRVL